MVRIDSDKQRPRPGTARIAAPASFSLFAVAAPGLEGLVAEELSTLGFGPETEPGGVGFAGSLETVQRANLWLRTASRVIARLGEFDARGFNEVVKGAKRLPWERFLSASQAVRLRVTCRKSRLYHSGAVAQRLAEGIEARLQRRVEVSGRREEGGGRRSEGEGSREEGDPDTLLPSPSSPLPQLVIARLFHDRCLVSVDTSGALLHLRGYRQALARAPLRETLAAAVLRASGWMPDAPLLDPMCGSGTIAIEAALIARRIPPGANRSFAFMGWPEFDATNWQRLLDDASAEILPAAPAPIQASDRDAGATQAAASNAERAGVRDDIELSTRSLSAITPPATPGYLVTNPPYGVRVGERERLRDLYAQLGNVARRSLRGWTLALVSADAELERQLRIPLEPAVHTSNGGIAVRFLTGMVR